MNIAIFTPCQNPYSETFIQAHKKGLKGTVFYYYGYGTQLKLEGVDRLMPLYLYKLHRIRAMFKKRGSADLWKQCVLYSLSNNKIDVVLVEYGNHAHYLYSVLKEAKIPVVVHFHGYDASVATVIESCKGYKAVFQFSRKIIAVSKVMESRLLAMGCPKEKMVYNVYGPNRIFESVMPKFSKKQFLSVGRFTDKKAPYYSIMAFQKVLQKYPEATLLMAGNGVLLNVCKNLVKHLKLENNVFFLGIITPDKYVDLLSESLAFVQHSITADNGDMEGTPLSVLEASAAGLPVISTCHAGIPDVVEHEKTGLLCQEHDVDGMAENMLRVLEDLSYAKYLGKAGKEYITCSFSLERHLNQLERILKNEVK
ncbi:glycosyltransferase [Tamlana fucoidanivorans]|uniref:Glycosyltransferase n=1 Tax=Allotamlana fucoidanivorans TaxID=2583814 RepID=A0A5C4SNM0_9FLAO|nr:glycosyltransferase [Tamlana fucoidanivorans]TNJ45771.1 glycosyltransferase [Tamlana fucoidanivorans]